MRRLAIALALTASLAGCAGTASPGTGSLSATGDQLGGKIPNGMSDVPAAMSAATAHCAKYGKKAMLTQMATQAEGGLVAFECR
jgi:hypothetical protein